MPKDSKWENFIKKKKTLYTTNCFKISFRQEHDANEGKAMAYNWSVTLLFWNLNNFYLSNYLLHLSAAIL